MRRLIIMETGTNTAINWGEAGVLALAAVLMIAAAYKDARCYRIPNVVSLALLALFPAYVATATHPVKWAEHIAIFALVLAGGFLLYVKKYIGAGDIKLMAVIALWAGPGLVGMFLFITTVAGGLLAVMTAAVAYYRLRRDGAERATPVRKAPIPYGVAIATGGLCTLMMLFHPVVLSFGGS